MLNTIWKFSIPVADEFTLKMPLGSVPLSVGVQSHGPVLWAAVNNDAIDEEEHRFSLRGTGYPMRKRLMTNRFVGTFRIEHLGLVFHLFDGGVDDA